MFHSETANMNIPSFLFLNQFQNASDGPDLFPLNCIEKQVECTQLRSISGFIVLHFEHFQLNPSIRQSNVKYIEFIFEKEREKNRFRITMQCIRIERSLRGISSHFSMFVYSFISPPLFTLLA